MCVCACVRVCMHMHADGCSLVENCLKLQGWGSTVRTCMRCRPHWKGFFSDVTAKSLTLLWLSLNSQAHQDGLGWTHLCSVTALSSWGRQENIVTKIKIAMARRLKGVLGSWRKINKKKNPSQASKGL